jgi:hypothetical protein
MKKETVDMLKALKKSFYNNINNAKQNGDWLEKEQWKTMLESIEYIEEQEGINLD